MMTLNIQDIDDDVYQSLKALAQQHGLSLEQHIRNLLTNAAKKQEVKLGSLAIECFSSLGANDLKLPERTPYQPVEL